MDMITNYIFLTEIKKSPIYNIAGNSIKRIYDLSMPYSSHNDQIYCGKRMDIKLLENGWECPVDHNSNNDYKEAENASVIFYGFPAYYKALAYCLLKLGWKYTRNKENK